MHQSRETQEEAKRQSPFPHFSFKGVIRIEVPVSAFAMNENKRSQGDKILYMALSTLKLYATLCHFLPVEIVSRHAWLVKRVEFSEPIRRERKENLPTTKNIISMSILKQEENSTKIER